MFKRKQFDVERLNETLSAMADALGGILETFQAYDGGATDVQRVNALEGAVEALRGEIAASLIKADALKATALAAEDRARGHMKRGNAAYELAKDIETSEDVDSFEAIGRAYQGVLPEGNDETLEDVSTLSNGLVAGRSGGSLARSAKRR